MNINRRTFLRGGLIAGVGLASAAVLSAGTDYAARTAFDNLPKPRLDTKPLENIITESEKRFVASLDDGWYIQYSVNAQLENSDKNIENIRKLGFNDANILTWPGLRQTKLYIGKYASMAEAVQEAEKLKGTVDEVGIVESRNKKLSWNLTANLRDIQPYAPPTDYGSNSRTRYDDLIDRLVDKYNEIARLQSQPELQSKHIKALLEVENSKRNPNAISHKLRVASKDGNRRILVESRGIPLAYGLFMLTPLTMKHTGLDFKDRFNQEKNSWAAINYFGELYNRNNGDLERTFAAYNAGQANVDKYNGVPPFMETRRHVARIMGKLN